MKRSPLGCGLIAAGGFGLLATVALFTWLIFTNISALANNAQRVVVPGRGPITLTDPGTYTIFQETHSVVNNVVYGSGPVSGLTVTLYDTATGNPLRLDNATGGTYSSGQFSGHAIFDVIIPAAGTYELVGAYTDGSSTPQTVLAVNQGFGKQLIGTILGGFSIMFFGLFLAIGLCVAGIILLILGRRAAAPVR